MALTSFVKWTARLGYSKPRAYAYAGDLITEPLHIGNKSLWPDTEGEVQELARVAGFSPDELRELVGRLMAARQDLASDEQIRAILQDMQVARRARGGGEAEAARAARSERARKVVAHRERVVAE